MKQTQITILIIIFSFCGICSYAQNHDTELSETINIESSDQNAGNRSISILEAYFHPGTNTIEVIAQGYGRLAATIVDADGIACDQVTMYTDLYCIEELIAPDAPGTYYLVLRSNTFSGQGQFTVY